MADVNNFTFTGRLGADAKVSVTPNGKSFMELSVANTTGFGDFKKTNWLKVVQWGDKVNNVAPIFTKGSLVGGSGEFEINAWTDKTGAARTEGVVTCMKINLLVSKKAEDTVESMEDIAF